MPCKWADQHSDPACGQREAPTERRGYVGGTAADRITLGRQAPPRRGLRSGRPNRWPLGVGKGFGFLGEWAAKT